MVITIVVLLILAGVSVNVLIESNLIEKAKVAETKYEQSKIDEKMEIGKAEDVINEYLNGKIVEESKDKKPGELEKEDDTTYIINSIEDLVVFSNTVTTGEDNFEGKTVKLGCDLDFNSIKSYVEPYRTDYAKYGYDGELKELLTSGEGFKTIGVTTEDNSSKSFCGTFEGNGKTIYNLYINVVSTAAKKEKRGLFASNIGTINNLNLLEVNLYLKYCPEDTADKSGKIAGICAQNAKKGVVNNCKVSGKIELNTPLINSDIGGIAAYATGNINNCVNMAQVIFRNDEIKDSISIGGICGAAKSSIENCYNTGEVSAFAKEGKALVGGIVGHGSLTTIKNCYNTGKISGETKLILRVGGICGNLGEGSIINAYSTGEIAGNNAEKTSLGMIIGINNLGSFENIYYLKKSDIKGIGEADTSQKLGNDELMAKTEEQMKSKEFVTILNQQGTSNWLKDETGINNGYPILKWQVESEIY